MWHMLSVQINKKIDLPSAYEVFSNVIDNEQTNLNEHIMVSIFCHFAIFVTTKSLSKVV